MIKRILSIFVLWLFCWPLYGQYGNTIILPYTAPPAGGCTFNQFANDTTNGNLYFCDQTANWKVLAAAGGTLWSAITSGANANAGTFSATGNTWDFSAATLLRLRVGAACATSANGDFCYDSTNNKWLVWQGAANKNLIAASNLGAAGQPCLSNADGSCTFADPIVSGPDAIGVAPTMKPVFIAGWDGTLIQAIRLSTVNFNVYSELRTGATAYDARQIRALASGTDTVTTVPPANASTNVAQVAGTATDTNSGIKSAGTIRVVIATDQPQLTAKLLVTPDSVALPANQSVNVAQVGGTAVVADPCAANAKSYISISQTANTQLVTGTANKKIYICSINLVVAAANNVALVEGTGTVCATGTAGVTGFGGATAATGWNFAANGGLTYGNGSSTLGAQGTNADNLCLYVSAANQTSGGLSYVVQ